MVSATDPQSVTSLTGRLPNGRFQKGAWKGGPGRKKGDKTQQNQDTWNKLCRGKHLTQVYWALYAAARSGDVAAMKLYLERTLGKVADVQIIDQTVTNVQSQDELRSDIVRRLEELKNKN